MAVDDGVQFVRGAVTKTAVAVSPASVVVVAWRASNILAVTSLLPGIVRSIVETLGEVAMLIGRTATIQTMLKVGCLDPIHTYTKWDQMNEIHP